jgi:hypothetical protein
MILSISFSSRVLLVYARSIQKREFLTHCGKNVRLHPSLPTEISFCRTWRSWNRCQDGTCFVEDWSPYLEMPVHVYAWIPYISRISSVFSVCPEYAYRINHTSEYAQIWVLSMLKTVSVSPGLAVCQRLSDIFHTLTHAIAVFHINYMVNNVVTINSYNIWLSLKW